MRKEFSSAIEELAAEDDSIVFITGDLGYNALENLQGKLGKRFINAGVAEQNMVGVAAGFAHKGYKVFCYSIAPFIVYRCLEQFRNDVCFHNLPVFLVGNGGGYGYGIMGSSHHTLEDIACLSGLQNANVWVPAFSDEVGPVIRQIVADAHPAYLRLGAGKTTPDNSYSSGSFKVIHKGAEAEMTVFALGPVANNVMTALGQIPEIASKINVITALHFPLKIENDLMEILASAPHIMVAEEHIGTGGLAQQLSVQLLEKGVGISSFKSLKAEGYPNSRYGSQAYHQKLSGLDAASIAGYISQMMIPA
ncbi:Apulose-4-phosphate transketolase subunit B [Dyadobacter sp. CECT 9275]|uniref:Apulose-4-phosphate transketolase subunit B n=1 Tax=Dyadobacter helix TaxID=2822344 RepID=A0A916NC74_9BACT|nr:transketolase [Dyadobacter sp. CECT 9275]CAG5002848.1 Apulose-4-phosphate transketolase subunit B [Dyadobacter sp. CECT 9275]